MPIPPNIQQLIDQNRLDEALTALTATIDSAPDPDMLIARGQIYWRTGHRAAAISDYTNAAETFDSPRARVALDMTRQVMDFYNPDLLNP